jgi:hypothetical protein
MGSFKAFVEIGRVCVISHGKEFGQLVVIADVVDQNRVRKEREEQAFGRGGCQGSRRREREPRPPLSFLAALPPAKGGGAAHSRWN